MNPSLWRQARLNMSHGLFQVTDRIYQVRGFDISNMTIIEGEPRPHRHRSADLDRDRRAPASSSTASTAATRPVTAVIYTHSHVDHYGGVRGVVDEADVTRGQTSRSSRPTGSWRRSSRRTCWPAPPMIRRGQFQFGATPAQGAARPGRRRPRQGHLARHRHADPADRRSSSEPIETHTHRRRRDRLPARARDRGAGRDAHVLSRPAGAEPGRERHPQPAQHLSDPRRAGRATPTPGPSTSTRRATGSAAEADVVFAQHHWPVWGNCARARLPGQAARHSTSTCTTRRCGS